MKNLYSYVMLIMVFSIPFLFHNVLAYSENFMLLIETMDIPEKNIIGQEINEDIYNEYKLFVYGNPLKISKGQRWKDVADGKWTKNFGPWNGAGRRGEYWILGTNYNGKEVHNHLFPVDIEPPTEPTEWRYAIISDALESWQETDKYVDEIQKEYIISQNLMRNNVIYNIKVTDIGFNKVRVENYPTWRTKGTVYTERYDMNNKRWAANFMVLPMAGDADLEGFAKFPLGMEYNVDNNKSVEISMTYGADVLNLTSYAKKEHIKEIKSELYINNEYIEDISATKVLGVSKDTVLKINQNDYEQNSIIKLEIQIKSTLLTTFITDGTLVDVKNYTVFIKNNQVLENTEESKYVNVYNQEYTSFPDLPPPKITSIEIKRIVGGKEKELLVSKKTGKSFICAGQTIAIYIKAINEPTSLSLEFEGDSSIRKLDSITKLFEWTEAKSRNQKTLFSSLKEFEKNYDGKTKMKTQKIGDEEFKCVYIIPYKTKQTLHSWNSLREISKNAFKIDEGKLFSRITKPYEMVFKVKGPTGASTERIELDAFERWDTLYNRNLLKYIKT